MTDNETILVNEMQYYTNDTVLHQQKQRQKQFSITTKIVDQTKYVSNEISVHQTIHSIQENQPNISILHRFETIHYFNPLAVCNVNDQCDFFDTEHDHSFVIIKYKRNSVYIYNISAFLNNQPKRVYMHYILESYQHLLNSFMILNNNNICFFQLSSQSIGFYSIDNPQCFLHGFQNSLQISLLHQIEYIEMIMSHVKQYTFLPFEIHVLFYILKYPTKWLSERNAQMIIQRFVDSLESNMPYIIAGYGNKSAFIRKCTNYLFPLIKCSKTDIIHQILKEYQSWDNYSLSILYLHYIQIIINSFDVNISFFKSLRQMMLQNVSPIPSERISLNQTLENVQQMFRKHPHWN